MEAVPQVELRLCRDGGDQLGSVSSTVIALHAYVRPLPKEELIGLNGICSMI